MIFRFIDLMVPTTPVEYVKLVISCLDYACEQYLSRVILQKALTSTNEVSRRWSTRFLSVLASYRLPDFSEWGIRLLLGQLGDESVKVIRHAIRILHIWLPTYPNAAHWLRTAQLDSFGDAGVLLKAHSYSDENVCMLDAAAVREAVRYWMKTFNSRYMQSIDDDIRVALLSIRRSLDGGFSRSSGERLEHFGLRAPVHLFASLARHNKGRIILMEERVTEELVLQLTNEFHSLVVKGALVALGQLGSVQEGFLLLPLEAVPRMIRLAEEAPVLSIRGAAFWALNMLGALALAKLGWESNRHRHVVDKVRKEGAQSTEDFPDCRRATHTPVPEIAMDRHCGCLWTESSLFTQTRRRSWSATDILDEARETRSRLRRTKSDIILRIRHECAKEFPNERYSYLSGILEKLHNIQYFSNETNAGSRTERTMTGESCPTSARRRATTIGSLVDEWEMRSRTSTIAQCLSQGLVASRSQMEVHGAVNRNVGDPVRYVFMSKDEVDIK
uniref:RICTOR_V domain-containing protein n=1 Tax=Heterorhabditis bacteriophora TaxID=37862 RepID=A0A1I7XBC6_HETBA